MRAHLVGSVNLGTAEAVIGTVAEHTGSVVDRITDGETGERINWFEGQVNVLSRQPQLKGVGEAAVGEDGDYMVSSHFEVRDGISSEELEFGPLGYARDAIASFDVFRALKSAGRIPGHVRFQVSLPTPVAVTFGFIEDGHQQTFEDAYERHLMAEVAEIRAHVPDSELAIQWDVAVEMAMLEGVFPTYITGDLLAGVVERLVRIGDTIPEALPLGYHLCYGNRDNEHWKEPEDAAKLAAVANGISAGVRRNVDWIHLPVPIDRDDDGYFAPLQGLALQPQTELFLGLLHKEDGLEGAQRRIATARHSVPEFGIATECGMGREPSDAIIGLLDLHTEACLKPSNTQGR